MKIMQRLFFAAGFAAAIVLVFVVATGCELSSADSVTRDVPATVAGVYSNPDSTKNEGKLVARNSGAPLEQLDLRQSGDMLEGIGGNGEFFTGTIGNVDQDGGVVSFTLDGQTTAGKDATMSGTIAVSGGKGEMRGTWIEEDFYSTIYGEATGPSVKSNVVNKVATPTISPASGTYTNTISVTMSTTTSGAEIRYTTNGSDPTDSSTVYSSALSIGTNATIKARGFLSGYDESDVATATYTF